MNFGFKLNSASRTKKGNICISRTCGVQFYKKTTETNLTHTLFNDEDKFVYRTNLIIG